MLAGMEGEVKPDRMVIRFVCEATGEVLDADAARAALLEAQATLRQGFPELTPRRLDYLVWNYQRERPVPSRMAILEGARPGPAAARKSSAR